MGMGTSNPTMWDVSRMSTSFYVSSRSYRSAPRPALYGLFALVSIGASTAIAQSGAAGLMRLFSSSNAILPNASTRTLVAGAAIALIATALGALWPLIAVARIDPAQALRTE
jgi:hypothetical protein